ncbi:MAG TPA: class I SAM-dependent methyltransferase [Acidimicrobiia bacterium]|jgi:SAM-dependent methyltransferase
MNANQELWEKGDFTRIAATMRDSGEALVKELGITNGMHVLDLGGGDGTTALPAARLGADVVVIDIARNLVEAGTRRAEAAGLTNIRFEQGDASHLDGVADDSFDLVVTIFGAMFAPDPFATAAEMVRVTKPGGRIVMGNWIPGDPTLVAQILKISGAYAPPPPEGFVSPVTWGVEEQVVERFTAAGVFADRISCERATFTFDFPRSPSELVEVFRSYYGPTMNAFAAAQNNGRALELQRELEELFTAQNTTGTDDATVIPATFLQVTVTV